MEEPDKKENSEDAVTSLEDSSAQTDGKHVCYQYYLHYSVSLQYVIYLLNLLWKWVKI